MDALTFRPKLKLRCRGVICQRDLVIIAVFPRVRPSDTPLALHYDTLAIPAAVGGNARCTELVVCCILGGLIDVAEQPRPRRTPSGAECCCIEWFEERFEAAQSGEHDVTADDDLSNRGGGDGGVTLVGRVEIVEAHADRDSNAMQGVSTKLQYQCEVGGSYSSRELSISRTWSFLYVFICKS